MKKYYYLTIFFAVVTLGLIMTDVFSINMASGEQTKSAAKSMKNEGEAFLYFYDDHGQLIESYTEAQMQAITITTSIYKENKGNEDKPFARIYDENGIEINAPEEIQEEMYKLSNANKDKLYVFRNTSFNGSIGVGINKTFYNPKGIIVEPQKKFESMAIYIDSTEGRVGRIEVGNFHGALNIPLDRYIQDGSYSIWFMNQKLAETNPIVLAGGIVIYN